ncbi:MAG: DEAD/DEAH box helicase [Oscillospiraceae bacterium]
MSEFNFEIQSAVKHALEDMGFEKPTEIQEKAIPLILQGKDVIGKSQTGSGKTVAFGVPAIELIDDTISKKLTQVLVLCPTRELAIQATNEFRKLTKYTHSVKTLAVYGGQPIGRQIPLLRTGAQIVVGTPGRVMDHIRRKTLKLNSLKMVVLDEADEMLNMGFREDIETILKEVPQERQTVLFSATMPKAIMDIVDNFQKDPVMISVAAKQMTVETIKQYYIDCPKGHKADVLFALVRDYDVKLSIVFCNTKKMVDELTAAMRENGIAARGLHGDMRQRERDNVMYDFRKGTVNMLIATDVAARGIDVDDVEAVFNFDIPLQQEYYVHRIGRTGRAGKEGLSFTLAQGRRQLIMIKDIVRMTKTDIQPLKAPRIDTNIQLVPVTKSDDEQDRPRRRREDGFGSFNRDDRAPRSRRDDFVKRDGAKKDFRRNDDRPRFDKPLGDASGILSEDKPRFPRKERVNNEEMYKMRVSVGRTQGATPGNILGAVAGESGLRGSDIGSIIINGSYSTVEIPLKHKDKVLQSVNGAMISGKHVEVE